MGGVTEKRGVEKRVRVPDKRRKRTIVGGIYGSEREKLSKGKNKAQSGTRHWDFQSNDRGARGGNFNLIKRGRMG